MACIMVASLTACEKHGDVYKGGPDGDIDLKNMTIPADFDWKTSDDVKCVLAATAPARVEVYTNSECTPVSRIANLYVDTETEPVKLVVARGVEELYMRYMDQQGIYRIQPVEISQGELNFTLPAGSRNFSNLPVKSTDEESKVSESELKGTVLFEDNYPVKGDYDFNDYVITYDLDPEWDKNGKLEKLEVELKFVAKGGQLLYEPYLRLKGIKYQLMKDIEIDSDTDEGVGVETFEHLGNDNDLILKFTGISEAMQRMKQEGSEYINTTKGHTSDEFVELEFDIHFVGNALNKFEGGDIYDFFLGGKINGSYTEIHAKEFSSTRLMTEKIINEGEYCTEDNFVWVMKIDKELYDDSKRVGDYEVFPYLNERVGFLKGYPQFKGYVETSGKGAYDWCEKTNRKDEFLIFFKD